MIATRSRPVDRLVQVRRELLRCPPPSEWSGAKEVGSRTVASRRDGCEDTEGRVSPHPFFPRVWRKGAKPPRRRERRPAQRGDCAGASRLSPSRKSCDRRLRPRRVPCSRKPPPCQNSSFGSARRTKRRWPEANSPSNASIARPGLLGSSGNHHSIAARRSATKTHAQPEQGQPGGRDQNAEQRHLREQVPPLCDPAPSPGPRVDNISRPF
jgi:hypothetical protein